MTATLKFKSIWYSFFQAQNSMFIQKTIKPIDKTFNTNNNDKDEDTSSTGSSNSKALATKNAIDDYRIRREKNNESVRKSRAKNRVKLQECAVKVKELKDENVELNTKLNSLENELGTLRNLFQYCFSFNSNQMPFKPSEIPTSTLCKIIMQNKSKFMQPVISTTNILNNNTSIAQATQSYVPSNEVKTQNSYSTYQQPQTQAISNIGSNCDTLLEQSKLFSLDDLTNGQSYTQQQPQQQPQQQQDQMAIFDEKDNILINELKQSLIDFIKNDDNATLLTNSYDQNACSSSTISTTTSSSPFISSPTTPSTNNDYLLNENDILIDDNLNTNENFSFFLNDHDYSVKRTKFDI